MKFPEQGKPISSLLHDLEQLKKDDLRWREGKAFSYIYYASPDIIEALSKAYTTYFSENALNPSAFPSLSKMQSEVISMCKELFHADDNASGIMTSGGTESILMAVKAAKEFAKKNRKVDKPEVIMPVSAHPAFNKACDYFDIDLKIVPVGNDFRVDPSSYEPVISENTILLVASAPSYPQGVVDPISDIGQIALKHNLPFHVDACVGGFVLPFLKKEDQVAFDFSVPGVSSISADIHKYGFASKGSSVVLYRDNDMRKAQFYVYTGWPGGIYASPSIMGTRPGGAIAVAWTVFHLLGRKGYEQLVEKMMQTAKDFQLFLNSYDGIHVLAEPDISIFSIKGEGLNIYELGDEMHSLGWQMDRQQDPASLHLSISPIHAEVFEKFKKDFDTAYKLATKRSMVKLKNKLQVTATKGMSKLLSKKALSKVQKFAVQQSDTSNPRSAALYGMIGDLKGTGTLDEMIVEFLDKMTK